MKGFTLLEILIALFVISVGLLAIAGVQITALRLHREAYDRSVVAVQKASLKEQDKYNPVLSV